MTTVIVPLHMKGQTDWKIGQMIARTDVKT